MAAATGTHPDGRPPIAVRTFRTRAVLVSTVVDLVIGLLVVGAGVVVGLRVAAPRGLPLALAVGLLGLLSVAAGLGRINARLEIHPTALESTWGFARHRLALADLSGAALVEKGRPAPGGAWERFIGGGFFGVLVWWLVGLVASFAHTEPSAGSHDLVVVKHHGAPVQIRAIGTWSIRGASDQAAAALHEVESAISAHRER